MALTRIKNTAIPNLATSKITSGTFADARISSSSVVQHSPETDLQPVKADITALALREATNESSAAFNLPGQFIETFTDDTNLGTQTNCDRSSGKMTTTTLVAAPGNDANTLFLMEPDATNGATTFTDISAAGVTITGGGGIAHTTAAKKFGATSVHFVENDYLTIPTRAAFDWGTGGAFTIDCWIFCANWSAFSQGDGKLWDGSSGHRFGFKSNGATMGGEQVTPAWTTHSMSNNTWYHIAWCRHTDGSFRQYVGGTELTSTTGNTNNFDATHGSIISIGDAAGLSGSEDFKNVYLGGIRVSNVDRTKDSDDPMYIATGTSYTPPTAYYGQETGAFNATGTVIQAANAVGSAKTKVGGTMLYKDVSGTNTLGTDLKVYFTCNGGTNWTEATSYNAVTPVYSTGVKQVRLGETTCTSGTDVRYKCEWANQADGSKQADVYGIGINY